MRCVRNFDYPFAAADKFFYQKRRNNLVVAADIMSLRNFRELFPITFQIKRFIQRRNYLVLCPGPMGEGAGYAGGIASSAIDGEKCAEMVKAIVF